MITCKTSFVDGQFIYQFVCCLPIKIDIDIIFDKHLKGIVAVDPVEVTDGDGWKVNFGLVTHVRACYNGPLPKFDQNLDIK